MDNNLKSMKWRNGEGLCRLILCYLVAFRMDGGSPITKETFHLHHLKDLLKIDVKSKQGFESGTNN
jgi:hypothetical protein